eukprot:2142623-Amphidinium_carterae.1
MMGESPQGHSEYVQSWRDERVEHGQDGKVNRKQKKEQQQHKQQSEVVYGTACARINLERHSCSSGNRDPGISPKKEKNEKGRAIRVVREDTQQVCGMHVLSILTRRGAREPIRRTLTMYKP